MSEKQQRSSRATGVPLRSFAAAVLDIVRVSPDGSLDFVLGPEEDTPIRRLVTAPHPEGIWVIWSVESGGVIPPIRFARIDVPSAGVLGPGDLSAPIDIPLSFAATALGRDLVVAWGNDSAGGIMVSVLDEAGALKGSTAVETAPSVGPISIIGAPSRESVLVA